MFNFWRVHSWKSLTGAWKLSCEPGHKFPESAQTKNGNLIPEETFGRPGMLPQKLFEELMKCQESVTVKDHDFSS